MLWGKIKYWVYRSIFIVVWSGKSEALLYNLARQMSNRIYKLQYNMETGIIPVQNYLHSQPCTVERGNIKTWGNFERPGQHWSKMAAPRGKKACLF